MDNDDDEPNVWHESIENLLAEYCDEAQVNETLHRQAFWTNRKTLTWFQLPIIILSTISGSLQFLSKSISGYENIIVTCTGSTSLFCAILSSIMSYLSLGERMKSHMEARTAWQNFYIHIKYQLKLAPVLRRPADEFMEEIKRTYERLFEISPVIDRNTVSRLKKKLRNSDMILPNYINGMRSIVVYREEDD